MKARILAVALMACSAFVYAGEASKDKAAASDHKGHGTHNAVGVVKKVDAKAGVATIVHEPLKAANMPTSMTMDFKVQDKAMLGKLGEGKKVEFEFMQHGSDYVITRVK